MLSISSSCKITASVKNPNLGLFSDNCLISLSRPRPSRALILGRSIVHNSIEVGPDRSTHCVATEARPWSCAALQDMGQISSLDEREAASEHFLLAHVPPQWTEQSWQAVCQSATILSVPIGMCSPRPSPSSLLSRLHHSWISLSDLWARLHVPAFEFFFFFLLY